MEVRPKSLKIFLTTAGSLPFLDWLHSLKDERGVAIVKAKLLRVRLGNMGHCRSVGEGVSELKIDFGPGYRVYFGQLGDTLVILLTGGNKRTQDEDIKAAKEFWEIYKKEKNHADY